MTFVDGEKCIVDLFDPAGQDCYTYLRDQWICEGDGFVILYSITSYRSFLGIQECVNRVLNIKYINEEERVPIMIVGNNTDRESEREVPTKAGAHLARELDCGFIECSTKQSIEVEKAFFDVARGIRA